MNRDELKTIIKECLLEIFIEGSPKNVIENVRDRNQRPKIVAEPQLQPHPSRKALEKIFPNGENTIQKTKKVIESKKYDVILGGLLINKKNSTYGYPDLIVSGSCLSISVSQPCVSITASSFQIISQ